MSIQSFSARFATFRNSPDEKTSPSGYKFGQWSSLLYSLYARTSKSVHCLKGYGKDLSEFVSDLSKIECDLHLNAIFIVFEYFKFLN